MRAERKPEVLVTRPIYPDAMEALRETARVTIPSEDRSLSREELLAAMPGKQGLVSLLVDRIDAPVMDAAGGSLRVIANYAVGFDNIDLAAATERGIQVGNTPDVLTQATADLTWALMLAVARGVVTADADVRRGGFHGWGPTDYLGYDVYGQTLGIVGMGRIGQAVARRAVGFGMRVLYVSRTDRTMEFRSGMGAVAGPVPAPARVSLDELLETADFISLHVPLTEATHRLIGREQIERMKTTAFLINTSRGKVIHEAALVTALREKRIAGAGLDVFEEEPALAEGLASLDNVVLLPHVGSATHATRRDMGQRVVDNVRCGLAGRRVPHLVNLDVRGEG